MKKATDILNPLLHGENIAIAANIETKTIGTGVVSVAVTPPTGYTKTILLSAYPRSAGNITMQGITVDVNAVRFYNQTNSSWTGECVSYWLCVK